MRRIALLSICAVLFAAACGGDSPAGDGGDATAADGTVAKCSALLTWRESQQGYLDYLADVPLDEFDPPSPQVLSAGLTLGNLLLEASREALQAGCAPALEVGSEELCAQVAVLTATGPAAESHLANLTRDCP